MAARSYSSKEKPSLRSRPDSFTALIEVCQSVDLVYKALSPEGVLVDRQRARYSIKKKGGKLTVSITASDMVAFKATVNSIMRQIELSLRL